MVGKLFEGALADLLVNTGAVGAGEFRADARYLQVYGPQWAAPGRTGDGANTVFTAPGTGRRHRIALTVPGATLTPSAAGRPITTVADTTWTAGEAGVFTASWPHFQYSNPEVRR